MFVFKCLPLELASDGWEDSTALEFLTYESPDDAFISDWNPSSPYASGARVIRNTADVPTNIFVSLINDNADDPKHNYVGRPPIPWLDETFGYGNNSWLGVGKTSQVNAFDLIQGGYTWSFDEAMSFKINPRKMLPLSEAMENDYSVTRKISKYFYGTDYAYLILDEVFGSSVTITYRDILDATVATETITIPDPTTGIFPEDWHINPELPSYAKHTIIRRYDYTAVESIQIDIAQPNIDTHNYRHTAISGCYFGTPVQLGKVDQTSLTGGYVDYSKVEINDWGHVSILQGRFARKLGGQFFVPTQDSDRTFKMLQHLRATPSFYLFSNNLSSLIATGVLTSSFICVMGIAKSPVIESSNARQTNLDVTIESMPTEFSGASLNELGVCEDENLPSSSGAVQTSPKPPVPPPSNVPVDGITLSAATVTMLDGFAYTLVAVVSPNEASNKIVSWSASGDVTVDPYGRVTATYSTGSGTVTASCGGYSDTCDFTVVEA